MIIDLVDTINPFRRSSNSSPSPVLWIYVCRLPRVHHRRGPARYALDGRKVASALGQKTKEENVRKKARLCRIFSGPRRRNDACDDKYQWIPSWDIREDRKANVFTVHVADKSKLLRTSKRLSNPNSTRRRLQKDTPESQLHSPLLLATSLIKRSPFPFHTLVSSFS
ncbi:Aamy domain-containing protein [Psidium guajava]|nr:Aamy domain-containing protein [Psidium guajava]